MSFIQTSSQARQQLILHFYYFVAIVPCMPALSLHVLVMLVENAFLHLYAELSDKALWTVLEPQYLLSCLCGLVMYASMSTNL